MDSLDINDLRSLVTLVSFITFLGIVVWAYGLKGNKQRFAEAANLPFADDDTPAPRAAAVKNAQQG